jgi:uncharacterized phage protein gp47/JayE
MPWSRPALATLITRVATDMQSAMSGVNAFLRRAMLTITGRAVAGAAHGLYGHQVYMANQLMLDKCDADFLARWAAILGKPRNAAKASTGPVIITGNNAMTVDAGTILIRSDGWEYTFNADATIANGTVSGTITATTAGASGDCTAGMTLTFASPVAGVNASVTVGTAGIGGGADVEDIEDWRARVIQRLSDPPKAGTSSDYIEWAESVSGVTRAWCYPKELGPGTVTVRFMTDDAPDGPFPDTAAVAAVQAYINSVCPVDATVTVVAPIALPLNPSIHLIPDTAANRTAVTTSLSDLLARESTPGATIPLSHFEDAIGNTVGVTDYVLSNPVGAVVAPTGYMTTLGAITWQ